MKKEFFIPKASSAQLPDFSKPWLAPLAGYSDLPFRLLCRSYGAAVCETEMISAKGLVCSSPATSELLYSTSRDQPLVIQLFGGQPEILAKAVHMLAAVGHRNFDFNMGCPVRKVLKQKAGAALMEDYARAMAIANAMIAAGRQAAPEAKLNFGFKLRLPPNGDLATFGKALEEAGASWLTIHPRTASQGYTGRAHWEKIGELAQAVNIPVIASGDLLTAAAGWECMRVTGASTVMYARGALHNPFIFWQHTHPDNGAGPEEPNMQMIRNMIYKHMSLARESYNERRAFGKIRSLLPRYVKGLPGIREFRANLCMCQDWASLMETIDNFWEQFS